VTYSFWPNFFVSESPGVTRLPIEVRYPYFDLRLVRYMLSIPPIPWCLNKGLLREAMRGALPDEVRLRPKTPLAGDQIEAMRRRGDWPPIDRFECARRLSRYVDLPSFLNQKFASSSFWTAIRPHSFNRWLLNLERPQPSPFEETSHVELH
jgi:asparagine synthase (glutamine-hydrolysing)